MPFWTDPVLRGRLGVCLALGLRFFPLAGLLVLRSWGTIAPSLTRAAGLHGVALGSYLWRVAIPLQRRALLTVVLLVGLLATAEVGMVSVLYPGNGETLPLDIFYTMGYPQPASRVAALCAVELAVAGAVLAAAWAVGGGDRA